MSTMKKAAMLKLAAMSFEMGLDSLQGELHQAEDGSWRVGRRSLEAWLAEHAGEEVVVVLGTMADERPLMTRTCRTCGRDYTELECPTCRANRIRLRGKP